jgi:pimeloyl-ACP methyl ester carboxylesterase
MLFADLVTAIPDAVDVVRYPGNLGCFVDISELVRSRIPQSEPFVLLAESFSTPIAIQFAATNPPNLKGVILCAGFAASPVPGLRRVICSVLAPVLAGITPPDFAARFLLVGSNAPGKLVAAVRSATRQFRQRYWPPACALCLHATCARNWIRLRHQFYIYRRRKIGWSIRRASK